MASPFWSLLLSTAFINVIAVLSLFHCHLGQHTFPHSLCILFHHAGSRAVKITTCSLHLLYVSDYPPLMALVILIKTPINSHIPHHDPHPASWKSIWFHYWAARSLCHARLALSSSIQIATVSLSFRSANTINSTSMLRIHWPIKILEMCLRCVDIGVCMGKWHIKMYSFSYSQMNRNVLKLWFIFVGMLNYKITGRLFKDHRKLVIINRAKVQVNVDNIIQLRKWLLDPVEFSLTSRSVPWSCSLSILVLIAQKRKREKERERGCKADTHWLTVT